MASSRQMKSEFNQQFSRIMDSFMNKYGDYIGDVDQLDALITDAFDDWANESGWFE